MTGIELKKAVKADGIRLALLAEKSGIKERTLLSLFVKKEVEDHYLKKIEKAGIELHFTTSQNVTEEVNLIKIAHLEETIERLEEDILFYKSLLTPELIKKNAERLKKK